MQTNAIVVKQTGSASVMNWTQHSLAEPEADEVQIRHSAIGLNYIDVYFRSGTYPAPALPFVPGLEAAGVVEKVGMQVSHLAVGDRVAYASPPLGAYAEQRNIDASKVVKIPDGISEEQAAAMMLKGMTAQYLLRSTYRIDSNTTLLFHAAAGGVGQIAVQWAKHLGAKVIATVGSAAKAERVSALGADHVIRYDTDDFVEAVAEFTKGNGVDVVYDAVGQSTFLGSLDCLKTRGTLVSFGQASGKVADFDIGQLSAKGSLYLTRPTLFHYTATPEELAVCAGSLFEVVQANAVKVSIDQRFALADAVAAHEALEARQTTGSTLLIP